MTATTAPRLAELQAFLIEALRRREPLAEHAEVSRATAVFVAGNDRLSPAEQADLYREQYWLRHVAALTEDYPGLRAVLGEAAFDELARAYLAAHPPRDPSLRDLGAHLLGFARVFTQAFAPIDSARRAAALEMIAYEASFLDLFDGADSPALDPEKLMALAKGDAETVRVRLDPLLALHHLRYAVHTYRLAVLGDEPRGDLPDAREVFLVLYRGDGVIRYDELEADAFRLLEALARGAPLGSACEELAASLDPDRAQAFGAKIGGWFQDWTAKGFVVDLLLE